MKWNSPVAVSYWAQNDPGPWLVAEDHHDAVTLRVFYYAIKTLFLATYLSTADCKLQKFYGWTSWPLAVFLVYVPGFYGMMALMFYACLLRVTSINSKNLFQGRLWFSKREGYHSFGGGFKEWLEDFISDTGLIWLRATSSVSVTHIPWNREIEYLDEYNMPSEKEVNHTIRERKTLSIRDVGGRGVVVFVVAGCVGGPILALICTALMMNLYLTHDNLEFSNVEDESLNKICAPLQDGPVRLGVSSFLWSDAVGNGVIWRGSLHTRFHVTNGAAIFIGGRAYSPTYVSRSHDIVVYFGPNQIRKPREGDELAALLIDARCSLNTVRTFVKTAKNGVSYYKIPSTIGGTSGSPIFRVVTKEDVETKPDEDDEGDWQFSEKRMGEKVRLDLVGLSGHYVKAGKYLLSSPNRESQMEILETGALANPQLDFLNLNERLVQHFAHPGSGKTRTIIPEIVNSARRAGKRVIITGPTRLVCQEMYSVLKKITSCNLYTQNSPPRKSGVEVLIMPHAVACDWIWNYSNRFVKDTILVIDEAHMQNRETIFLVKWARLAAERKKITSFELTATGYDVKKGEMNIQRESNFPIRDDYYDFGRLKEKVLELALKENTGKIVVFLPSVEGEGGVDSVADWLKGKVQVPIVKYHRRTYELSYEDAKKDYETNSIVLTTNMSEIGANLNADVVVDSGQQLAFYRDMNTGAILSKMDAATEAQVTQRRGRVGRRKCGQYFAPRMDTPREKLYTKDCIEEEEADLLLDVMEGKGTSGYTLESILSWMKNSKQLPDVTGLTTMRRVMLASGRIQSEKEIIGSLRYEMKEKLGHRQDIDGQIVYLLAYDARDRRWYSKYIAAARHFEPVEDDRGVQHHVPKPEAPFEVEKVVPKEICTPTCTKSPVVGVIVTDLDHEYVADTEYPVSHHHKCAKCGHVWQHRHRKTEMEINHVKGLDCPCCTSTWRLF